MADTQKVVHVPDLGVVAFPGAMEDEHIATVIKSFRAKKTPQPLATEESEHARQLKPAQPLSTAIPSLPQWANTPVLSGLTFDAQIERAEKSGHTEQAEWLRKQKALQDKAYQKNIDKHPIATGVGEGVGETAEGLTSPANLALMILAPESKIMSGLFAIQSLHGSYKDVEEARKAYREGRNAEASKYATQAILNLGIAGLAGHHAVKDIPVPEPVKAFMKDESGFVDPIKQWPQFKQWFGNSKVVEQNGAPRAVFHSTPEEFDEFDPRKSHDIGIHFGTPEQADAAAKPIGKYREGTRLIPAYIKVENPLRVKDMFSTLKNRFINRAKILTLDTPGLYFSSDERAEIYDAAKKADAARSKAGGDYSIELIPSNAKLREEYNTQSKRFWSVAEKAIRRNGYDGLVYNNKVEGKGDSYAVFEPTQIKSAIGNSGAFDPKSGSLTDPRAPKLADVKAKAAELKPTTAYKSGDQSQPFYLKSENLIAEKMKGPMPAEDVHKMLLSNGVKPEEMKWTGLDELLQGKGKQKVTPQEIQEHLAGNNLQVQEVMKGQPKPAQWTEHRGGIFTTPEGYKIERLDSNGKYIATSNSGIRQAFDTIDEAKSKVDYWRKNSSDDEVTPKFSSYALPGAEPGSYRELLVTMPSQGVTESDIANYFQPGKIVEGYGGKDKVLAFHPSTPQQGWSVDVIHVDDKGNPVYGERARRHSTQPEPQKLGKSQFRSSHWDEPNVLGHVRFNDRTGPNGEKILHIEEAQSDWGQKGRREGFALSKKESEQVDQQMTDSWSGLHNAATESGVEGFTNQNRLITDVYKRWNADPKHSITNAWFIETGKMPSEKSIGAITDYMEAWKKHNEDTSTIPQMPFSKTWPELLLKRMMKYASDNNYSGISWTPGDLQAERYDLSKQISHIEYKKGMKYHHTDPQKWTVNAYDLDGNGVLKKFVTADELPDIVGKDIAEKIVNDKEDEGELSGLDLKVGGSGMKGFYDKIIPDAANKLGKQWGAKVGETKIESPSEGQRSRVYSGKEYTKDEIREIINDEKSLPRHLSDIALEVWIGMKKGWSFADAMETKGTPELADALGGTLKTPQKTVPYLPITPQMRAGVKSIPYSLFSIPLAAGALTLQQVKAQGDELQKKFKPTGVTK